MKKKLICLSLAALLLTLSFVGCSQDPPDGEPSSDGSLEYTVLDDHVIVSGISKESAEIVIPATYNGLPITKIGAFAFADSQTLTSVVLPQSITTIGANAFANCANLTSVSYAADNGNASVAKGFGEYTNLSASNLNASPSQHGRIEHIENNAFENCGKLENITFSNHISFIGSDAFLNCTNMQMQTYGNAVYLGNSNYPYLILLRATDPSISSCSIHEDTLIIYQEAFLDCQITDITIPSKVTYIGEGAFAGNPLSNLHFDTNSRLKYIGTSAFQNTALRTSLTLPSGIVSIGLWAFDGYASLFNYYENAHYLGDGTNDYAYLIGANDSAVWANGELTHAGQVTSCVIHPNTRVIGGGAFGSTSVAEVIIPEGIISIGEWAFSGNSSLLDVQIPASVTMIGSKAFEGCRSLASVTFAEGSLLAQIGENAFTGCFALSGIVIPQKVRTIGGGCFTECTSLTNVTFAVTAGWHNGSKILSRPGTAADRSIANDPQALTQALLNGMLMLR